jgi:hypothetical protein
MGSLKNLKVSGYHKKNPDVHSGLFLKFQADDHLSRVLLIYGYLIAFYFTETNTRNLSQLSAKPFSKSLSTTV